MDSNLYINKLRERLNESPDSRLFLSLAEELGKRGSVDEAIEILENGVMSFPEFLAARLALGKYYLSADMLSNAEKEFNWILKRSGQAVSQEMTIYVLKGLASVYKRLGNLVDAAAQYKKALEIDPYDEEAASYLSIISGKKEELIKRLNMLLHGLKTNLGPAPLVSDKDLIVSRLHNFLSAIKIRFAAE